MPLAKRQNAEGGGQPNKRHKWDEVSGPAPKTGSVSQKKASTRSASTKKDNSGDAQIMKPGPSPKLQLRYIPPLREPHGFPCFSDGDVLVVLHSENTRYHLRLHSLTLRNVSTVLDGLLLTQADENIPKKMLGPNPTELVFCLELSNDPKSCWGLQRGSLYLKVTPDNCNAILPTRRQMKGMGLDGSYDDNTETAPISPVDRGSIISPPQTPVTDVIEDAPPRSSINNWSTAVGATEASTLKKYSEWTLAQDPDVLPSSAPRASEELTPTKDSRPSLAQENEKLPPDSMVSTVGDRTLEACSGRYASTPFDDSEEQEIKHPCTIRLNPTTELGATIAAARAGVQPIPEATVLAADMPQTHTSGPESHSADMTQYAEPEKRCYSPSIVKEGVPNEGVSESRVSLRAAELDIDTSTTPISASRPFATTKSKETSATMIPSANTSNLEAPERDYTETPICLLKPQGVNPIVRTGDMVDKTSSAGVNIEPTSKETRDDDECQFILVRSKRPSPPAVPVMPKAQHCLTQHRKIETLLSLFRIAYHKVPIISHTDMELALFQTENLIAAAKFYEALEIVVAPIHYSLAQGGHLLFHSIALEPIRWLNVSIDLRDKTIFQEAVIHLVGSFSDADNFNRKLFSGVPRNVVDLIYRKVVELDRGIFRVNEVLMSSSIYEPGIRARLDGANKSSLDVNIAVHYWREWFIRNLAEARTRPRHLEEPNIQSKLGMLYRAISAGDNYLLENEMMDSLRRFQLPQQESADRTEVVLQWDTAADDLTLIKAYASRMVRKICYNRSMLDPAEAGFTYLTCTSIYPGEFPWAGAPRN